MIEWAACFDGADLRVIRQFWVREVCFHLLNWHSYLHFRYKIEAHFLQLWILGHESESGWIWCIVVELEINSGWRCTNEIPAILWRKGIRKFDSITGDFVLTPDKLRISSLILSSFWWPIHGQTPAVPSLPDWSLMNASCSLLNSPRIDCKTVTVNTINSFGHAKSLTLSLTVSLILAPALLTTPVKNEPNDFAPAVILLVTAKRKKNEQLKNGSDNESARTLSLHSQPKEKKKVFPSTHVGVQIKFPFHTQQNSARMKLISNLLPFPTIPAWSSVGEPFSETGRESAPPVALNFQTREWKKVGKREKMGIWKTCPS